MNCFLIIVLALIIVSIVGAMVFTPLEMGTGFWLGCVQVIAFIMLYWIVKNENKWD
jgi:hypothetical protein